MIERVLEEAWVDKYVSVVRSPLRGSAVPLAGRIRAVGNDGPIIQLMGARGKNATYMWTH